MKNILIISPENWTDHTVSKHHYAKTLAQKGFQVFFLNPPEKQNFGFRFRLERVNNNLFVIRSRRILPGLRFLPKNFRSSLESRWLKCLEKFIKCEIDTIWSFENSRFYDFKFSGSRLKIYHQVDLAQNFHLKEAASSADICFCVDDSICSVIKPFNSKTFNIGHGVIDKIIYHDKQDYEKNFISSKLNAIYIGNLNIKFLDSNLLIELFRLNPNIRFHMIGGYDRTGHFWQSAASLENVIWWGKVESEKINQILQHGDINLIAYKSEYARETTNSHKILEYLLSGKVIVSTYIHSYSDKPLLIEMAKTKNEYFKIFNDVVTNISDFNSIERQSIRISYAKLNTYQNKVDLILNILENNLLKRWM